MTDETMMEVTFLIPTAEAAQWLVDRYSVDDLARMSPDAHLRALSKVALERARMADAHSAVVAETRDILDAAGSTGRYMGRRVIHSEVPPAPPSEFDNYIDATVQWPAITPKDNNVTHVGGDIAVMDTVTGPRGDDAA
jgi:hypothetical protein